MKCGKCHNWWSYAHTPDLTYITNHDPRSFAKNRKMHCPHCGAEGVLGPHEESFTQDFTGMK